MSSLEKKCAVVTGGSRGLGRGIVEALAKRGARVCAIARDEAELAKLTREVPNAVAIRGDTTDGALADRVLKDESPDFVILCAGAKPVLGPIHELSWEDFSTNWLVDTKGTFVWLTRALKKPLKRGSHIIVVSSGAAIGGSPVSGGYASAKRAQWFIADYAATEIKRADLGLRIHCIMPNINGSTELGRAGVEAYAKRAGVTPEEFLKKFGAQLTPEIMGEKIAEMLEAPERFEPLAYRIGGAGLTPIT